MTQRADAFLAVNSIRFKSAATKTECTIRASDVVDVLVDANKYLEGLSREFQSLGIELYSEFQLRNLSGFVGEVFSRVFALKVDRFRVNPHADGRPDLIDVASEPVAEYFSKKCFGTDGGGKPFPLKKMLAPFKHGGLEVKATIGTPRSSSKAEMKSAGVPAGFALGTSRVGYLTVHHVLGAPRSLRELVGAILRLRRSARRAPADSRRLPCRTRFWKGLASLERGKAGFKEDQQYIPDEERQGEAP